MAAWEAALAAVEQLTGEQKRRLCELLLVPQQQEEQKVPAKLAPRSTFQSRAVAKRQSEAKKLFATAQQGSASGVQQQQKMLVACLWLGIGAPAVDMQAAHDLLHHILKTDPNFAGLLLGDIAERVDHPEGAIAFYRLSAHARALVRVGSVQEELGRQHDAAGSYEAACAACTADTEWVKHEALYRWARVLAGGDRMSAQHIEIMAKSMWPPALFVLAQAQHRVAMSAVAEAGHVDAMFHFAEEQFKPGPGQRAIPGKVRPRFQYTAAGFRGYMHDQCDGYQLKRDNARLRDAAEHGHTEAQYHLGVVLESHWKARPNHTRMEHAEWFVRAAQGGHADALRKCVEWLPFDVAEDGKVYI